MANKKVIPGTIIRYDTGMLRRDGGSARFRGIGRVLAHQFEPERFYVEIISGNVMFDADEDPEIPVEHALLVAAMTKWTILEWEDDRNEGI